MSKRRVIRSISTPIILASIGVPISIALLVGWTLLVVKNAALPENVWLLVLGGLAFVTIMAVLVMFAIFLVRELLEVRRQASFIDSVTHELKSPLASLKLCLETMARDHLGDEQRESLRQMMLDDVDRLSSFIDDVLQASRLSHDRVAVMLAELPLRELTERCVATVRARAKLPDDAIDVRVDPEMVVLGDRAALEIVLKNLIDNAVKYSPEELKIVISARVGPRDTAIIEVRDYGIGIERRHLKRIFSRFYRVNTERVRQRRGTGLGLFVASALVRNLGGRLEAESEGIDQGTTMRIVLPSAIRSAPARSAGAAAEAA
jgi:signal transduction histidine kinase